MWFLPLDFIKFAMKATIIKSLRERKARQVAEMVASSSHDEVPLTRTQSRAASIHESLYSNHVNFIRRATRTVGFGSNAPKMSPTELKRLRTLAAYWRGTPAALNRCPPHLY